MLKAAKQKTTTFNIFTKICFYNYFLISTTQEK